MRNYVISLVHDHYLDLVGTFLPNNNNIIDRTTILVGEGWTRYFITNIILKFNIVSAIIAALITYLFCLMLFNYLCMLVYVYLL